MNALRAGSIAGITTSAAAVAPYGAAVHAACRYNALTKNGPAQARGMQLFVSRPQTGLRLLSEKWESSSLFFSCLVVGPGVTSDGRALQAKINSLYDVPDRPRRLDEIQKPIEAG